MHCRHRASLNSFRASLYSSVAAIAFLCGTISLRAQSTSSTDLLEQARPKLEAVYAKGELRAKRFQAEWLADSSGYFVRERDAETGKNVDALYNVQTGERSIAMENASRAGRDKRLSPDGGFRIEIQGKNLVVRDTQTGTTRRLKSRSLFGDVSYRDPSWSPDGSRVLFTESNSAAVPTRNMLVPSDPSYPDVRKTRFARVGEKIARQRIGVIDADGSSMQWLPIEIPERGCYFGEISWADNSEEVLIEKLSRFRDTREFLLASLNGDVTTVFTETNEAWAVGSHGINSGATWIDGGNSFVFLSEKDGWRQAFTISRDGTDLRLLTPGDYDIIDRAEQGDIIDEAGGWYYFYASPTNATQRYLHRVPLDGTGAVEQITPIEQAGWHAYQFSPDRKWALHTYSTLDAPPIVDLVSVPEHRSVRVLQENSQLRKTMNEAYLRPTEFLELEIADGVTVDAWMIKPFNFDATRRYPVFVYVYGEPYSQTVIDRWGAAQIDFHRVIADLGYLVVSIDNRGTPAPKGAAWRRSIFGSLGPLSTEEQAAALNELGRTYPYVDLSRVGIWGWSGGGSNTLNALFRKPDIYHVGIAVVPKPQPHLYNAWFQEIYMRTPEENADGYARSAPINFAEGLIGKLLIVTGSGETNTHIQIIEGLVDRLIKLGKQFDYMVYPNRDHGLREGPGSEVHVRMLITRYLLEHLAPGPK